LTSEKIILQGGGEHAKVVLDGLLGMKARVVALFDPKYGGELLGIRQRGEYDPLFEPDAKAIVAIGNNMTRKKVVAFTKHEFTKFMHTTSIVSANCSIGEGSMIMQGATVQVHARVGSHVIVNTGARIDHDCELSEYVHVAPGVVLCGRVKVGEGAMVGAGAVVLPGVSIGAWATVGAGAVVTKDVDEGAVVMGNPARVISNLKSEI